MRVESLNLADAPACARLWHALGLTRPWNDPVADAERAMTGATSTVLGVRHDGHLLATAMVGHDGHRGWVYYLGVDADQRGRGLARGLMAAAEEWLAERSVPKVQLMVRHSNSSATHFYERLGYGREEVTVMSRWLDPHPEEPKANAPGATAPVIRGGSPGRP